MSGRVRPCVDTVDVVLVVICGMRGVKGSGLGSVGGLSETWEGGIGW